MYLNAVSQYLSLPGLTVNVLLGAANWTVEFWFKTVTLQDQQFFKIKSATSSQITIATFTDAHITATIQNTGGADIGTLTTAAAAYSNATWTHLAVSRSGATTRLLFLNGTLTVSASGTAETTPNATVCVIGEDAATARNFYLSEFRASNIARYTATFSAPSTETPSY